MVVSSKSYAIPLKQTPKNHDSADMHDARSTCPPSNPLKQTEEQSHSVELLPARPPGGFAISVAQIQEANHQGALPSALDPVHHATSRSWQNAWQCQLLAG